MYLRLFAIMVLGMSAAGCKSVEQPTFDLESRWRPLERVVESNLPLVSDTATTTIGTQVYVADLAEWLQTHPVGDPRFVAVMLHEREHARRQAKDVLWLGRYLADPKFALDEEQRGWRLEALYLRDYGAGFARTAAEYASALGDYRVPGGKLISEADALVWFNALLSGPGLTSLEIQ